MRGVLNRESFDVMVIGGGPSGLFTSLLLSKEGIKTVLIDKESEIGKDVVCSGVISKEAFQKGDFSASFLSKYEKLWKNELGNEIKLGKYFHKFYSKLSDNSIDTLFDAAKKDGLLSFISEQGKFDWHKNAVLKILKSPNLRKALLWESINNAREKIAL